MTHSASNDSDFDFDDDEIPDETSRLFNKATEHVKKIAGGVAPAKLLQIYAFYKQATIGSCNTQKPRFFEFEGRAKWDAWNKLRGMESAQAKIEYVKLVTELDPDFLGDNAGKNECWAAVSCLLNTDDVLCDGDKTIFDFCKEDNLTRMKDLFEVNSMLLWSRDDDGLGLIHWAADRGNLEVLKFLIDCGIDVNMVDNEGQTALHYATSCDYFTCVEFLLNAGADCLLGDNEGMKPVDLTTDSNILKLLKQFM